MFAHSYINMILDGKNYLIELQSGVYTEPTELQVRQAIIIQYHRKLLELQIKQLQAELEVLVGDELPESISKLFYDESGDCMYDFRHFIATGKVDTI